jgi:uncharacterized phage protein gp47/JayE
MTITQLITTPTRDEIFDQLITWLVNMGLPADQWRRGGVARSILRVVASSYIVLATMITLIAKAGFLDTATGDFLTLLAYYVYGVTRQQATFASGEILATNAGGGTFILGIGDLVVQNTITKKTYKNTIALTLSPGDTDIPIEVEATELGTASNATAGQVTTLVTSLDGVTVTNATPILGIDAWTDEILRAACLAKRGALSLLGPRGAYEFAIRTALNDGSPVNVNRWSISPSSSKGIVTIVLASPTGAVTVGDEAAVEERIEEIARPDTVRVNTSSASVGSSAKSLIVWAKAVDGLSAAEIEELVQAAVDGMVSVYPIGGFKKPPSTAGFLYDDEIRASANGAHPSIFSVETTPDTDISVPDGTVAALTLSAIDVRIVTVPTGGAA